MDLNLEGKRAVVCGSTEGIGKAIAIELASNGAGITLIARNKEKLEQVLKVLPDASLDHHFLVADFDDPGSLKTVLETYSTDKNPIEILINNTGGPPAGKAIEAELEDYRIAFNRHLICNQILAQNFISEMKGSGYGRIVNIISTSVKSPIPGLGVSNTIRGAVANWAKTLSLELAPFGITVNNVLPGATMTARLDPIIKNKAAKLAISEEESKDKMIAEIPAGRFAEASEVASAVAFLASPSAGYINGINLPVDGGRLSCL